jgi:hypothetical protein
MNIDGIAIFDPKRVVALLRLRLVSLLSSSSGPACSLAGTSAPIVLCGGNGSLPANSRVMMIKLR